MKETSKHIKTKNPISDHCRFRLFVRTPTDPYTLTKMNFKNNDLLKNFKTLQISQKHKHKHKNQNPKKQIQQTPKCSKFKTHNSKSKLSLLISKTHIQNTPKNTKEYSQSNHRRWCRCTSSWRPCSRSNGKQSP